MTDLLFDTFMPLGENPGGIFTCLSKFFSDHFDRKIPAHWFTWPKIRIILGQVIG